MMQSLHVVYVSETVQHLLSKILAFRELQRDTAQAARTTCHSRFRASPSDADIAKSGRLLELVAMSRIPSRPQTVSACLQRSKIWLMVLAAGHKSQPLCGVSSVHCFLAMLSLVLRRPRKASQRKTRCLCDAGGHRYRSGARWGDREGQ